MAVDVVVPAAAVHRSDVGTNAAAPPSPISSSSTLAPASAAAAAAAICVAASAYAVSSLSLLPYYATFAASLACLARAVWPDRVDAALADARELASLARADLEADLRRLRDYAAAQAAHYPALTAPVHAAAEGCAATVAGWRRGAAAKWDEHRDAACAARFVLRVAALAARLAATVLVDAACDEARAWAPSVRGYLRGLVDRIRISALPSSSSSSCDKDSEDYEAAAAGFVLKDVVCLVGAGFHLLFTVHLLVGSGAASGTQFWAVCFAATCGLTMVIADWVDPPDDDADETDTTAATDGSNAAAGDGEASRRDEEVEVRESWRFLWVLVLVTHCVDAFLLHVTLGPQPTVLAIFALCNWEVLKAGRQVQLTPVDDGEGAAEGSVQGVDKWRRGAMVVYAGCSVKIFVVYLVLDCCMAALGFLWLFVMADLLLAEEDNLSAFDTTSGEGDDEDGEEIPALEEVTAGDDEEEVDEEEARKEHSNPSSLSEDAEESFAHCDVSSSEDEEETSAHCDTSSSEDEEEKHCDSSEDHEIERHCDSSEDHEIGKHCDSSEDHVIENHCDSSEEHEIGKHCDSSEDHEVEKHSDSSEEHEIVEKQQDEEPDYSSGGSTDDSWDLVDVDDPEMPAAKANCGANRKSRLFPWKKHAA